ncbi:unnamed protein product [Natator depressus]
MPLWHCQPVGLSRLLPMILRLGLWLLCSLAASQEICSSPAPMERAPWDVLAIVHYSSDPQRLPSHRQWPIDVGTLPAPRLFLDRLSAHQGDTAMLSCLVPCGIPVTRIVFCKDGKEISVQPKGGNTVVYDSPYTVSKKSAGAFSCLYQLKDDNNQENNSLSSDPWYLHVDGGDGSGGDASPQGISNAGKLTERENESVALATLQNRYQHSLRVDTQRTPTEAVVLPVEETMSPDSVSYTDRNTLPPAISEATLRGLSAQMDPALRGVTPLEGRHVPKIKGVGPIVGLAIMAGLALALLGCFLMKTGCVALQDSQGGGNLALTPSSILGLLPREPGPERSSPAAEDQIQSSAQPNDKVTGAVGRGQERDWLEPGSFCHKLQVCHPHNSHWLQFPANGSCRAGTWGRGSVRSPLAAPMHKSHRGNMPLLPDAARSQGRTPWSLEPALTRIPSAPQARMSPTLAASLIGAPGKEMVMEPVNQPARTSVWVNR